MFGTKISYPWTLCTPFLAAPKPADAMARDGFLDLLAVEKKGHLGSEIRPLGSDRSKVGPPSDVRWFINPMKTIVIGTINHSYWRYKPTERYRLGAHFVITLKNKMSGQLLSSSDPHPDARL